MASSENTARARSQAQAARERLIRQSTEEVARKLKHEHEDAQKDAQMRARAKVETMVEKMAATEATLEAKARRSMDQLQVLEARHEEEARARSQEHAVKQAKLEQHLEQQAAKLEEAEAARVEDAQKVETLLTSMEQRQSEQVRSRHSDNSLFPCPS